LSRWVTLVYKVPRDPSATRVYVWRKLKTLGAISLQDAVWVLPETPRTKEQFQWLAAEISELGGEVTFWASELLFATNEEALIKHFTDQVDTGYAEVLAALKPKNADLAALSLRYQQLQSQDYFQSKLGQKVRQALLAARGGRRR
jgi:hypothetical protein